MLTKHLNLDQAPLTDKFDRYFADVHGRVYDKFTGGDEVVFEKSSDGEFGNETAEIHYMGKDRVLTRRWIVAMAYKPLFKLGKAIFNWDVLITDIKDPENDTFVKRLIWKPPAGGQPCPEIEGFNVIPGFSAYAVSKDGRAYSRFTKKIGKVRKMYSRKIDRVRAPDNYYLNMNVRTESLHGGVLGIHRAIMLAFSEYGKDVNTLTVNHKNGRKRDNTYDNLEWSTNTDNCLHALDHGMRDVGAPVLVKDYNTGEVEYHQNMSEAAKWLKIGRNRLRNTLERFGGLIHGRYAVKRTTSNLDWPEYTAEEVATIQAEFQNWKDNLRCMARCIRTGALIHSDSPTRLSREVGLAPGTVVALLESKSPWPCNGFEFYYYRNGVPDFLRTYTDKEIKLFSNPVSIRVPIALYQDGDRENAILFKSIRDVSYYLEVDEHQVHKLLRKSLIVPTSKLGMKNGKIIERLVYENNL